MGPTTNAAGSVRSAKPDPILVTLLMDGGLPRLNPRSSLSTVLRWTILPFAATVPLSTLVTNSAADRPTPTAVASRGPLMPWPLKTFLTVPLLSRTKMHPGEDVAVPARADLDDRRSRPLQVVGVVEAMTADPRRYDVPTPDGDDQPGDPASSRLDRR